MKYLYLLLFILLPILPQTGTLWAASPFEEANELYQNGQYQEAITRYEGILVEGLRSPELYYNLGNCYYKKEVLGKAILYYRRALQLAPRDEDIAYNLALVKAQLKDDISPLPPFFLARWWEASSQLLSSSAWSILCLLFLWAGVAAFIAWLLGSTRKIKKYGFLSGVVLILLSILLGSLAYSQASYEQDSRQAVILHQEVAMQSAPDEESTTILLLHEGTTVDLLDQIGDWYKIRLENGEQGWLPTDKIEQI
ncbi:MAG: tetratricopeptide repeat protein [Bacteroidota bacterium]